MASEEKVYTHIYVIQIKICAEYQDVLPRPRLVCQEPGLRPIGQSPGVHDKSSSGLGSMSRYSAPIFFCFTFVYIFLFSFLCGFGWGLCGLPPCTVPSAVVNCNQTIEAPSMPCGGAAGPWKHSLVFMAQDWWNWQKMDEICISGQFLEQEPNEWRVFLHTCVWFYYILA